jgi:hypothetical protein
MSPATVQTVQLELGIAWCSFFKRPGLLAPIRYPALKQAYRAPSLFTGVMRDAGATVRHFACDDALDVAAYDGSAARHDDDVHLLYVMTHGESNATSYTSLWNTVDWAPGVTGLGGRRLAVAVFDTCNLIDTSNHPQWTQVWQGATLGSSLRVLLGFDGSATVDRGSAVRGKAFAELVCQGVPFADAWIRAVHNTSAFQSQGMDQAVAIGIGDSPADASSVLATASIHQMPPARTPGPLSLAIVR